MSINGLLEVVAESPGFRLLASGLSSGLKEQLLTGISGSHKSVLAATLFRKGMPGRTGKTRETVQIILITSNSYQAERVYGDLVTLLSEREVLLFPALEILPHEEVNRPIDLSVARLKVLESLTSGDPVVVVAPIQAVAERLMPAEAFRKHVLDLTVSEEVNLPNLTDRLVTMGYVRMPRVEARAHFSLRGDIVDIYPPTSLNPLRVEFLGDAVESIREFDLETQRSLRSREHFSLSPATEFVVTPEMARKTARAIKEETDFQVGRLRKLGRDSDARALEDRVALHLEKLEQHRTFDGMEQYKSLFFPELSFLVDYSAEGLVVLDEPARSRESMNAFSAEFSESFGTLLERGRALPSEAGIFASWEDLTAALRSRRCVHMSVLAKSPPGVTSERTISVPSRPADLFHGKHELFSAELKRLVKEKNRVLLVLGTSERAERVAEAIRYDDLPAVAISRVEDEVRPGTIVTTGGNLDAGFEDPVLKLVVFTETEVFGARKKRHRAKSAEEGLRVGDISELAPGDHVVHVNHGIGQYLGVETLEIAGVHRDYLVVKYFGEDKLYVPTDQVDLLQKYIGVGEDQPPKLYKLGGNEWARVKKRVKDSVQEMAHGLLQLYAERETVTGHVFPTDTVWQSQFEDAFIYEETADQLRAVGEVKRDMEKLRPMDRLLCGDVGYGKTEVAIRAAFKAVMDSKQVAVLVPTTILAQQHHRTFTERFNGYPLRVEMLSRFQTPSEQASILRGLENGGIDVVIGTHRLLSKDVIFKDMGLIVVDEEQRFGVMQKERLKELRKSVDVLTLTATPIPRTLHMALVGVRDMSVIETPPEGRFPIRTYVVEYHDDLVREAIMRELGRGGQVYFVHNRIQTIEQMAAHLSNLVPEARIAIAHGQMDEGELEQVMLDFLKGEYDLLLCTTIIETGMDISNVNTLVVYDADRMGLAQLYQLRGRVGRSNRVAYAYFTYRKDKILTEDAEKRLQAIKEFTELGSGFKIAMRDLEIRGAGNILGPEQHGFIASVGFELYCRLLEESIKELKGEVVHQPPEPSIDVSVDAYISDNYIDDSQQKVEVYKKVIGVNTLEDAVDLESEIRDRFGELPESVKNLLRVARIKVLARQLGIGSISRERDSVVLRMLAGLRLPNEGLPGLTRKYRGKLMVLPARISQIKIRARGLGGSELVGLIEEVLLDMRGLWQAAAGQ